MQKPHKYNFSSGPCAKYTNWSPPSGFLAGRSHRSKDGLDIINKIIDKQREILNIPDDYHIALIGNSGSGSMETLLWSLLGARPVTILNQCIFSNHWALDIVNQLEISDVHQIKSDFPNMSDVNNINFNRDLVFCWTSTTSGTSFQDANWIPSKRDGLTICDATSAIFSYNIDWAKLDATSFSWQKGIAGEAGIGTIVLSPKAMDRLEYHIPKWPIPRIFRLADNGKINHNLFKGHTINTPSMLCLEDFNNILTWAKKIGGISTLIQKIHQNKLIVDNWINSNNDIFDFLIKKRTERANQIACINITSELYETFSKDMRWHFLQQILEFCEEQMVGFDFLGHAMTTPHIRLWIGPTIESRDLELFLPWLRYAYNSISGTY